MPNAAMRRVGDSGAALSSFVSAIRAGGNRIKFDGLAEWHRPLQIWRYAGSWNIGRGKKVDGGNCWHLGGRLTLGGSGPSQVEIRKAFAISMCVVASSRQGTLKTCWELRCWN